MATLALPYSFGVNCGVRPWMSHVIYVAIAVTWLVPDRRIETQLGR